MDLLSTYLSNRDTPCPGCGYNLRGLTGERCPECNEMLALSVSLHDAHLGALMATLIPILGLAAAGAVVSLVTLALCMIAGFPPLELVVGLILLPIVVATALGPLSYLLIRPRGRRWFRQLPRSKRSGLMYASWTVTGLCLTGYVVYWVVSLL